MKNKIKQCEDLYDVLRIFKDKEIKFSIQNYQDLEKTTLELANGFLTDGIDRGYIDTGKLNDVIRELVLISEELIFRNKNLIPPEIVEG
jgi:hypothetical protein